MHCPCHGGSACSWQVCASKLENTVMSGRCECSTWSVSAGCDSRPLLAGVTPIPPRLSLKGVCRTGATCTCARSGWLPLVDFFSISHRPPLPPCWPSSLLHAIILSESQRRSASSARPIRSLDPFARSLLNSPPSSPAGSTFDPHSVQDELPDHRHLRRCCRRRHGCQRQR